MISILFYPINNNQELKETQENWVKDNSLYNTKTINGIPLQDYYENYISTYVERDIRTIRNIDNFLNFKKFFFFVF